jgi:uncharacterized protein YueI
MRKRENKVKFEHLKNYYNIAQNTHLEVSIVSLFRPSKNEVAFKITIGLVIDHY